MGSTRQTTPAKQWITYSGGFPIVFADRLPKAIMINSAGNVVLEDELGNQSTFTLAVGVPIQLRPTKIISTTAGSVIALFH